jgi:hypothetical protein
MRKKELVIVALFLAFALCIGSALAIAPACNKGHSFYGERSNAGLMTIRGNIYDNGTGVKGAHVEVSCYHNGQWTTKSKTSGKNGKYTVFFRTSKCNLGDTVVVNAEKDGWTGSSEDILQATSTTACFTLNAETGASIALIPEFGTVVGIFTILSAVGIFFLIRKK